MPCFFCDIQKDDDRKAAESKYFWSRFSEVPVSDGNCEIFLKEHKESLWDLTSEEWQDLFEIIKEVKVKIEEKFSPDGYNFGMNEGKAAGRSIEHVHFHLIPRYAGDVENPRGGVRNVIPKRGDYYKYILDELPERKKYLK
ncbi:HIT family protein [Candidatus Parcubacteria bacterium]|nr:MAG: HIT family protein [Candidatus Parcubacteria bacterium]